MLTFRRRGPRPCRVGKRGCICAEARGAQAHSRERGTPEAIFGDGEESLSERRQCPTFLARMIGWA